MERTFNLHAVLPLISLCVPLAPTQASPLPAEFAVRWAPSAGGPETGKAVTELLTPKDEGKGTLKVRYFEAKAPGDLPSGVSAILRERTSGTKAEVTWKYHGGEAYSEAFGTAWQCPLKQESKRKDEMDISVLPTGQIRRSFSRSCTSKASFAHVVPLALNAKQKGCASTVARRESEDGDYKVEEWLLTNGRKFVELSWNADDSPDNLTIFKAKVEKLVAAGAKPLDRSMTEISARCGG